nr:hypothetical protein [Phenylobacterium sp.]
MQANERGADGRQDRDPWSASALPRSDKLRHVRPRPVEVGEGHDGLQLHEIGGGLFGRDDRGSLDFPPQEPDAGRRPRRGADQVEKPLTVVREQGNVGQLVRILKDSAGAPLA